MKVDAHWKAVVRNGEFHYINYRYIAINPENGESLAPVVVISAADWEAEQKRVAALEKDAARYRFLQAASWHIETVSAPNKPDAEWSVSFYSKYGATLNENDPDRAIDAAIEKGA